MKVSKRIDRRLALLLLLIAATTVQPAWAMTYVQMRDADLVAQADGAVIGTVEGEPMPVFDSNGVRAATRYWLIVSKTLGGQSQHSVQVELPGWHGDEGPAWRAMGVVALARGDRVLVVFERRSDGVLLPLHLNLGVFIERTGGGLRYYDRALESAVNLEPVRNSEYNAARIADRFEIFVERRLHGRSGNVDYLVPHPARPKFSSITGTGTPVRWFEFDSGGTVNWRANSDGQEGMVQDEFQLFRDALNAWNNDATSRIQWGVGATIDPGAGNPAGSFGRVLWNDPRNEIPGSYSCAGGGGVLATATPLWQLSPRSYRGTTYFPILAVTVVVQDGAGCFLDTAGGLNGSEVLSHEVGHALGFGHSCQTPQVPSCVNPILDDALMRPSVHGDGRGPGLRVDDIAAANQWYFLSDVIFANEFE